MQREEDDVDLARVDRRRRVRERARTQVRESLVRRRRRRDAALQELALRRALEPADGGIHRHHLVAQRAQHRDHLRGARDRDVTLLTRTTEQHRDFHRTTLQRRCRVRKVGSANYPTILTRRTPPAPTTSGYRARSAARPAGNPRTSA